MWQEIVFTTNVDSTKIRNIITTIGNQTNFASRYQACLTKIFKATKQIIRLTPEISAQKTYEELNLKTAHLFIAISKDMNLGMPDLVNVNLLIAI